MPITRFSTPQREEHADLVQELVAELSANRAQGPTDAPEIIEETYRFGNLRHVTVVWDKWQGIDPEVRGRVIMDAYQQHEQSPPLNITMALGLTREEEAKLRREPQTRGEWITYVESVAEKYNVSKEELEKRVGALAMERWREQKGRITPADIVAVAKELAGH